MTDFFASIYEAALRLGGPGLFGVAFLDSSFVPLPEINDLLVVLMVMRNPVALPYYAAMATAGSVVGCYVLYVLARRGGATFLQRRMSSSRGQKVLAHYQRYGLLALMVPALLPPPAPFKIFVLLAGAAGISPLRFIGGVAAARFLRYIVLGWLAVRYGDAGLELMRTRGPMVAAVAITVILAGGLAFWWMRRRSS